MASTDLLIDGYNLLHAAGLGRAHYGRGELQQARQALLRKLFTLLTPEEIVRTAVVFDARQPPPHLPPHWYINGLRVVYARPHGDADLLLEQLIDEHSHPRQLTIVSSDQRLHRAAKTRRAAVTNSDEFLLFLEHRRRPAPEIHLPTPAKAKPTQDVAAAELAYWMSVFGDVKISELADPKPARPEPTRTTPPATPARPASAEATPVRPKPASGKSRPKPVEPEKTPAATKAGPELFSADWINELQRWVDAQQK
jgi:predicted RNA-binding protein with PIN domain